MNLRIPQDATRSKVAVGFSIVIGKIFSILGYGLAGLGLLIMLVFITDGDYAELHIMFLVLVLPGILLIIQGARIKRRIRRFRVYVGLISNNFDSLDDIAARTNKTTAFVTGDIQKMINKRYFSNAALDFISKKVIMLGRPAPTKTHQNTESQDQYSAFEIRTCPGCGANRTKERGATVSCEYCGSSII
ncbi:MAG: hypothetical protein FWC73_03685 [Defluviitaleaceae bacterium]|nr:hypothetical protein [Defluviitaleaceae bacterium]